jgi:hypothetical protein
MRETNSTPHQEVSYMVNPNGGSGNGNGQKDYNPEVEFE